MVCPVYRLGVSIPGESIAQSAAPGTRSVSILYAPQNTLAYSSYNQAISYYCSAKFLLLG